jgi:hypothetical protein
VLKLTSWFVLQVLPYLIMAVAAVVVLPGVAQSLTGAALPAATSSPPHEMAPMIEPLGYAKTAKADLEYR